MLEQFIDHLTNKNTPLKVHRYRYWTEGIDNPEEQFRKTTLTNTRMSGSLKAKHED